MSFDTPSDFRLAAAASVSVQVTFDPQYKSDLVTRTVKQKLIVYLKIKACGRLDNIVVFIHFILLRL